MNFFQIFLVSGKSHGAENVKKGVLGVFEHPFFCKIEKNEGDPLETLKKFAKKSHKAEKTCTKHFWSRAGLERTFFCWADLKKTVTSMPSASRSSVAQFSVSASQLIKLIKSVSSLVVKTSRERPKSVPYLRLTNSKRTSQCQSILFQSTPKTHKLDWIGKCPD